MRDQISKASIKLWEPIDMEDYYQIPLTKNKFAIVDKEDLDKIREYKWAVRGPEGYAVSRCKISGKIVRMHRIIMGIYNSKYDVDHINHDTLDNRKVNLRVCEHYRNCENKRVAKNKIGVTGVGKKKETGKYYANIMVQKKSIHLGYFYELSDAIKARKNAELKYFGEYTYNGK
jgi:hypothetical protein